MAAKEAKLVLESVSTSGNGTDAVKAVQQENFKDDAITSTRGIGLISFIKNKLPNWLKYIQPLAVITISFISLNYFLYLQNDGLNSIFSA